MDERIEYILPKNAVEKYNDFLKRSVWTILFILFIILVSVGRLYNAQLPYKGLWIVIASLIFLGHIILIVRKIHMLGDTVEKLQIIEGKIYMKLLGYKDQPDKLLRLAKDRSIDQFTVRVIYDDLFSVVKDQKKTYELKKEGLKVYVVSGAEDMDLTVYLDSIGERRNSRVSIPGIEKQESNMSYEIPVEGRFMVKRWPKIALSIPIGLIASIWFILRVIPPELDITNRVYLFWFCVLIVVIGNIFEIRYLLRISHLIIGIQVSEDKVTIEKFKTGVNWIDRKLGPRHFELSKENFNDYQLKRIKAFGKESSLYRIELQDLKKSYIILGNNELESLRLA